MNDTFSWPRLIGPPTGAVKSVSKEGRETRTGEIVIPWVGKVRFGRTMGDEMNNGINGLEGGRGREGRKTVTVNGSVVSLVPKQSIEAVERELLG